MSGNALVFTCGAKTQSANYAYVLIVSYEAGQ